MARWAKKKVYVYDLTGEYIREFESLYSCSKELGIRCCNLSRRIRKKDSYMDVYQFSLEKVDRLNDVRDEVLRNEPKVVYMYRKGVVQKVYKSIYECAKDQDCNEARIHEVIKGIIPRFRGMTFTFEKSKWDLPMSWV